MKKVTPEFNKVDYPFLKKKDFDKNGGQLGFLVMFTGNDAPEIEGVKYHSQIGTIFTAVATYDGLKALDKSDKVIKIEYSRPGGMI